MERTFKTLVFTGAITAHTLTNAYAEPHQVEMSGEYSVSKIDSQAFYDDYDAKTYHFSLSAYLEPLNTDNAPLAEAAFLNKASYVWLDYTDSNTDTRASFNLPQVGLFSDIQHQSKHTITAGGAYTIPGSTIILGAAISKMDANTQQIQRTQAAQTKNKNKADAKSFNIQVGKYFTDHLLSSITLARVEDDTQDITSNTIGVNLQTFHAFDNNTYLGLETAYRYWDTDRKEGSIDNLHQLVFNLSYYPNERLGFSLGGEAIKLKDYHTHLFDVSVEYFLTASCSLTGKYQIDNSHIDHIEKDTASITLTKRF